MSLPLATEAMKAGFKKAMDLRRATNKTQREVAESQRQPEVITQDQARLRANLKGTPSDGDLHKRYLKKLGEQETQIEKYQAEIKRLQGTEHEQKKAFEDFLANFSAE